MNSHAGQELAGFDQATLTPLVRQALGSQTAEITEWTARVVHGGAGGGSVFRYSGSARDREATLPWSLIQKVVRAAEDNTDPLTVRYWAREPLAYQSEILASLPPGLAAPRCFQVESNEQEYRFWLEDIPESTKEWSLEQYGLVARQLGKFNAAYLTGTPLPSWPWMSRHFLRRWTEMCTANIRAARESPDHPLVQRWYPGSMTDRCLSLWDERESFLGTLERLPQTLCHMDVFRRNLLMRRLLDGQEQTVMIDWAFVGTGAAGEEIAPLVGATVGFFELELEKLEVLDDLVFASYLAGLEEGGWQGNPAEIRLAYCAASALRFAFPVFDVFDESRDPVIEQMMGRPISEVVATWIEARRFIFRLADEARELMHELRP